MCIGFHFVRFATCILFSVCFGDEKIINISFNLYEGMFNFGRLPAERLVAEALN